MSFSHFNLPGEKQKPEKKCKDSSIKLFFILTAASLCSLFNGRLTLAQQPSGANVSKVFGATMSIDH